jgi:hypothetical protein
VRARARVTLSPRFEHTSPCARVSDTRRPCACFGHASPSAVFHLGAGGERAGGEPPEVEARVGAAADQAPACGPAIRRAGCTQKTRCGPPEGCQEASQDAQLNPLNSERGRERQRHRQAQRRTETQRDTQIDRATEAACAPVALGASPVTQPPGCAGTTARQP